MVVSGGEVRQSRSTASAALSAILLFGGVGETHSSLVSADERGMRRIRLRASLTILATASSASSDGSIGVAADAHGRKAVPGWGEPAWGGRSFEDSVAAYNPWTKVRYAPVVGDLDPTAPFDRVDQGWSDSITGAESVAPTDEGKARPTVLHSDWVAPYTYPRTFPGDAFSSEGGGGGGGGAALDDPDSPLIPIADRNLVASADKLRPPYAWRSSGDYPLIAPADRITSSRDKAFGWLGDESGTNPWAVGSTDELDPRFSRYLNQVHDHEQRRLDGIRLDRTFGAADADSDGAVSREEFEAELNGRQNKTGEEVERLWGKFHISQSPSMNKAEYVRLSRSGFDLGAIARSDIAAVLTMPGAPQVGFWGSGANCPTGTYVSGARLKVMPLTGGGKDDTGLNGVGLRCGGGAKGSEASTVEGQDGTWTAWADCPKGQRIFSIRARSQPHTTSRDNAGILGLEFGCRAADFSSFGDLRFGGDELPPKTPWSPEELASETVTALGPKAAGGGWTKEFMCPPGSAVCGAQAHVVRDQGHHDNMGIVDLRVYCCSIAVDCTTSCSVKNGGKGSVGCQVCQKVAMSQ